MITYIEGDLFSSPAKVLVNTVNTKGVMGKGIALRFKKIYPEMFTQYRQYCETGKIDIGNLYLYRTENKWILNFPTKRDWRKPSRVEYIEAGLQKFTASFGEMGITSIAFPALGCGNGELNFESQVKPIMEFYLGKLSISTFIYLASEAPALPEHRDVDTINNWLRSEPSALPFDEVWSDIMELLQTRREFLTPGKENPFKIIAISDPQGIAICTPSKTTKILVEELMEFWKQLRDFGISHGGISPEHRQFSYLMPLFEELPYVARIIVSASTKGLGKNPAIALQVVPPPLTNAPLKDDLFANHVIST